MASGNTHINHVGLNSAAQWEAKRDHGRKTLQFFHLEIPVQWQRQKALGDTVDFQHSEIVLQRCPDFLTGFRRRSGHAGNGNTSVATTSIGRTQVIDILKTPTCSDPHQLVEGAVTFEPEIKLIFK